MATSFTPVLQNYNLSLLFTHAKVLMMCVIAVPVRWSFRLDYVCYWYRGKRCGRIGSAFTFPRSGKDLNFAFDSRTIPILRISVFHLFQRQLDKTEWKVCAIEFLSKICSRKRADVFQDGNDNTKWLKRAEKKILRC